MRKGEVGQGWLEEEEEEEEREEEKMERSDGRG